MTRPPVRWADSDLPEELSRLIASAAPLQQDAAALARMRERLHDSLGPTFETRLSGANATSHVLSALHRSKWLCAAALATAGLSFLAVQSLQSSSRAATGAASQQPLAATDAPAKPSQPSTEPRVVVEEPRSQALPTKPPGSARTAPGVKASPSHPSHGADKTDKRAANSGEAAPSGLAAELRGLAEIRQLLHSSPTRALTLAATQERQFAQGALGPERELLRIEALIRAGRADEAKRRAARALSASNNPPYRERIEKLFAQTAPLRLAADGVAKQVTRE